MCVQCMSNVSVVHARQCICCHCCICLCHYCCVVVAVSDHRMAAAVPRVGSLYYRAVVVIVISSVVAITTSADSIITTTAVANLPTC